MSPRLWLGLGVCVLALSACQDGEADAGPVSTSSTGTPADRLDCATLLPDSAFAALGWDGAGEAEEHAGRCERRTEGSGAVTVGTRAQTSGDVGATLQSECDDLRSSGDYVDQPVAWLESAGDESCAVGLGDSGTGVAELYFVNAADEVVQVRVEALRPVAAEQLQAGMADVAASASDLTG
jgi:hypothetical protein